MENDSKNENEKQKYLHTLTFRELKEDNYKPLIEMLEGMISPAKIIEKKYESDFEILNIKIDDYKYIQKILFVISSNLRRNNEIPVMVYIPKKDNINNNINQEEKKIFIKLSRAPEYTYSLNFYDVNKGGQIDINKDSINLSYIIPNYEELQKTKFVTDSYINRSANYFRKYARYTSVLPRVKMLEKFISLIFGPKFEMVAEEIKTNNNNNFEAKNKKYSHYVGFQSFEFDNYYGSNFNDNEDQNMNMMKTNFVKLNYLITNFHLKKINEIRYMINQMIYFKFESANENEILSEKEFEEIKKKYDEKTNDILKGIKLLLDSDKIKFINDKKYEMLYDYIQNYNNHHQNVNNDNMNIEEENEEEDNDEENNNIYYGYINEIKEIKSKIKEDDFLQIQEPLMIQDEFFNNKKKIQKKILKEKRIKNIYNDYLKILNDMKSLIGNTDAWLCCPNCYQDICAIKENSPKQINKNLGIYAIQGSFINTSFKTIEEGKNYRNKENLEKKLNELGFKKGTHYDNLFCCAKEETVIGYVHKEEKYIFSGSNLCVRYPNLTVERVNENEFMSNFENIKKKVEDIIKYKETDEFKHSIKCKLCDFTVEKKLGEFKRHLHEKFHKENMEELKKEFLC